MKKIKCLCVVLCLLFVTASTAAAQSSAFSDLAGCENGQVIERWHNAGLISGYPDKTFRPHEPVTGAQFAKIISDLFVLDGTGKEFADVPRDAWYYPYVQKAWKYIDYGDAEEESSGSLFLPDEPVDMAEAIKILFCLTNTYDEALCSLTGNVSRGELIAIIDTLLGGETGFLYMTSVIDAHKAEKEEILPLVSLDENSHMTTWNHKGQVLLLSWHAYPEGYAPGREFVCEHGEIWAFTDKEVLWWYDQNGQGTTNWKLRFEQLLGLPPNGSYTHVSAFWVDPEDVIRPAYQTDTTKQMTPDLLDGSALGEHGEWFYKNCEYSYETRAYPWTRLGYTYDWSADETEYGLTEFIILPGSAVEVEWTKSLDEFVDWLQKN